MPLRLVQHLVARGLLTDEQGQGVLQAVSHPGTAVDTVLLERELVPEAELLESLGACSGLRPVNLADFEPNPQVGAWVPVHIAERWCVTPLSVDGPVLHVASGYPVARKELEEMGVLIGRPLELWVSTELRVRDWISNVYGTPLPAHLWRLLARVDPPRAALYPPPHEPAPPRRTLAAAQAAAQPPVLYPTPIVEPDHDDLALDVEVDAVPIDAQAGAQTPAPASPDPGGARAPASNDRPAQEASPREANRTPPPTAPQRRVRAAPWLPPSLQAAIERGEDISDRLTGAPMAAQLAWAVGPRRPASERTPVPAPGSDSETADDAMGGEARPPSDGGPEPIIVAEPDEAVAPAGFHAETASPPADTGSGQGQDPHEGAPREQEPARVDAVSPGTDGEGASAVAPPAPDLPRASKPSATAEGAITAPPIEAGAARAPGETLAPTPPQSGAAPSAPTDAPDWTLTQARAVLADASQDRDRLLDTVLRYASRTFGFAAVFAVRRGEAAGWRSRGAADGAGDFSRVRIPLDAPSLFRTVSITRGSYVGAMPVDPITRDYLASFGRAPPRAVFAYPVEVRSRLVAIVYADNGPRPISQRRLSDFLLFCQGLSGAFQQLLLHRRRDNLDTLPPEPALTAAAFSPVPEGASLVPTARPSQVGWESFEHGDSSPSGRAASLPPVLPAREYAPSDFGPLINRLVGPDPAARLRAVAELARTPDASAKVLARAFPGPSAWSRMPVVELPEAEELGPIPGALARLGRAGAGALAGLLDSDDAEIRYLALLTAGSLPYPVLVDGILRGLFDLEPDISSAARVAAAALKHVPRLEMSLPALRRELASRDPLRRSLVARALGTLHDRAAIDGLINLTGSDDEMCAQAAADALREITRVNFGLRQPDWTRWWAENRTRRRAEWLVAALRHRELDQRTAALEELSHALSDTLGYVPDAPEAEREAGLKRWEAALHHPLRGRRLAAL